MDKQSKQLLAYYSRADCSTSTTTGLLLLLLVARTTTPAEHDSQ
jgi:hypothetical protein